MASGPDRASGTRDERHRALGGLFGTSERWRELSSQVRVTAAHLLDRPCIQTICIHFERFFSDEDAPRPTSAREGSSPLWAWPSALDLHTRGMAKTGEFASFPVWGSTHQLLQWRVPGPTTTTNSSKSTDPYNLSPRFSSYSPFCESLLGPLPSPEAFGK